MRVWKRPLWAGFVCLAVAFGCNKSATHLEVTTSPQKGGPTNVKKGNKEFQMPQPSGAPIPPPK